MIATTQAPLGFMDAPTIAKPCLKWAGGKNQLIKTLTPLFPKELLTGQIDRYAEPFIGGGALFFHIAQNYPVREFYISDVNEELVLLYQTIRENVNNLIATLAKTERAYFKLNNEQQKDFFYKTREDFNAERKQIDFSARQANWVERAAKIIFLNRTCFNGLFRVNSKAEFNVPFGDNKNPRICDPENLYAVSQVLQRATIRHADFDACESFVDSRTFVYFDPPYRPISKTARFTAYSKLSFGDKEQTRLADFYKKLNEQGSKLMLSNSDPTNGDPTDDFFEKLYAKFNIQKIFASRSINRDPSKRNPVTELLITNYSIHSKK